MLIRPRFLFGADRGLGVPRVLGVWNAARRGPTACTLESAPPLLPPNLRLPSVGATAQITGGGGSTQLSPRPEPSELQHVQTRDRRNLLAVDVFRESAPLSAQGRLLRHGLSARANLSAARASAELHGVFAGRFTEHPSSTEFRNG